MNPEKNSAKSCTRELFSNHLSLGDPIPASILLKANGGREARGGAALKLRCFKLTTDRQAGSQQMCPKNGGGC